MTAALTLLFLTVILAGGGGIAYVAILALREIAEIRHGFQRGGYR